VISLRRNINHINCTSLIPLWSRASLLCRSITRSQATRQTKQLYATFPLEISYRGWARHTPFASNNFHNSHSNLLSISSENFPISSLTVFSSFSFLIFNFPDSINYILWVLWTNKKEWVSFYVKTYDQHVYGDDWYMKTSIKIWINWYGLWKKSTYTVTDIMNFLFEYLQVDNIKRVSIKSHRTSHLFRRDVYV
jgi:hypothetical protein